jgi:adenylosuccinate lyase
MRERGVTENDLFDRLAGDARLGLSRAQLSELVADPSTFTGAAGPQVAAVVERVEAVVRRYPEAAAYTPGPIL